MKGHQSDHTVTVHAWCHEQWSINPQCDNACMMSWGGVKQPTQWQYTRDVMKGDQSDHTVTVHTWYHEGRSISPHSDSIRLKKSKVDQSAHTVILNIWCHQGVTDQPTLGQYTPDITRGDQSTHTVTVHSWCHSRVCLFPVVSPYWLKRRVWQKYVPYIPNTKCSGNTSPPTDGANRCILC